MSGPINGKTMLYIILAMAVVLTFAWINKEKVRLEGTGKVSATEPEPAKDAMEPTPFNGKRVFMKNCKICHTWKKDDKHKAGPVLWGIAGADKGSKAGFRYSKAMLDSEGVWDDEEMNAFFANPKKHIKGTKMAFKGLKNDSERAAIIAFLRTLKD